MPIRRVSIVGMEIDVAAQTLRAIIVMQDYLNFGVPCGSHWLADIARHPLTGWSSLIDSNFR